ncbi:MAG TPA: methylmalonyl Co-A mutase-associated GTPase MeaB [Flavobacteriales bacterium]|nr:methylmalonyl Co-A mutase-associated GTPase MeaB [Flavobacteriales bacterium]HQW87309.1 methylmalonyl Co-A mutase-associated GTPase MeaB [Flavobacteriales bacterium]
MRPEEEDLIAALRSGDRSALARAITLVESRRPEDRARLSAVLAALTDPIASLRIGITGIPGAGKSTLIDALGSALLDRGHRVAVLAVDPSSQRSGGSILADKTRMHRLSTDPRAFVRPTATGGTLGGIALRTRETMLLCEAAGYDRVLVETVGAGQNESDVDRVTDLTVLLLIAGAGDELQGIKRGIMESADVVVVTKTDMAPPAMVGAAVNDLVHALQLMPLRDGRRSPVLRCSAITGEGVDELASLLEDLGAQCRSTGSLMRRRNDQAVHWLHAGLGQALLEHALRDERLAAALPGLEARVSTGAIDPAVAVDQLMNLFRTGDAPPP